jgi:hypothetical protein
MRRTRHLLLLAALLLLATAPAFSAILNNGIDTSKPTPAQRNNPTGPGCPVLWYGQVIGDEVTRFAGLGYSITTTVNPADLTAANLSNYSILVIAYTGTGVLGPEQADIQNFVQTGHSLFVHQPNAAGLMDYTPVGFDVLITNPAWCNFPSSPPATIVNAAHPITAGLADTDLSGAFDLVGALGPGFTLLTKSVVCGDPALAAGTFGAGRVAFDDGNGATSAFIPGTDAYWASIFFWLCTGGAVPTQHNTWGHLKTLYR